MPNGFFNGFRFNRSAVARLSREELQRLDQKYADEAARCLVPSPDEFPITVDELMERAKPALARRVEVMQELGRREWFWKHNRGAVWAGVFLLLLLAVPLIATFVRYLAS